MSQLTDDDLRKNKYPLDVLEKNIQHLSLITLVRCQHLDAEFCKKYVLNEKYQDREEYDTITTDWVFRWQPHLKYEDLLI